MALDVQKLLIDGLWTQLQARSGFTSRVLPGNRIRTAQSDNAERQASRKLPADAATVSIKIVGGRDDKHPTPFGGGKPINQLDYGIGVRVDIQIEATFEKDWDTQTLPLESEIEAVIRGCDIWYRTTQGYAWFGSVTSRKNRGPRRVNGVPRTVSTWTLSFETRPLKSQLIA